MALGASLKSCDNSSARSISVAPTRRAAWTSGIVPSTAAEVTTMVSGPATPLPSCGTRAMPLAPQKGELVGEPPLVEGAVGTGYGLAARFEDQRQRQHAAAAHAAEEIGPVWSHRRTL
ncbi:MAG: hypothetical protein WDN08_06675 [Rhizomicrobium sp.]